MRFKSFLNERIYHQGENLIITVQHSREASTEEAISTFIKRVPYESHVKGVDDVVIYSLLNYIASEESTKLLSSIKGKGPYNVNKKQYEFFMDQLVEACSQLFSVLKPDVFLTPRSSSPLIADFAHHLTKKYPKTKVINDVFLKKLLSADDVTPLINKDHPDWDKFVRTRPHEVEKLKLSLKRHIEAHEGSIELKKLYKPYVKFIKNFIELRDVYELIDIVHTKRVVILDDIFSTGATMIEMMRLLRELEPSFVAGLTVFKRN